MLEKIAWSIDLDKSNLEIKEFSGDELQGDLKYFRKKNPEDLSDYDRRVFNKIKDAELFLKEYKRILKSLSNKKICISREIPVILYKRRYIVLSIMGIKKQTYRSSERVIKIMDNVKKGDYFNLYDQTYFLTVKLKKRRKMNDGSMKYEFVIPTPIQKNYF